VARYIVRRLLHLLPILFVVSVVVFAMLLTLPGDPTLTLLGPQASQAQRLALRHAMGFDQPIPIQYLRWLANFLSGDFGRSLRTQEPVSEMLLSRIPVTLELTILSMMLSVLIGVPLGIVAALRRNRLTDAIIRVVGMAGIAVPHFWAGILLIMLLSVYLGWLPPSGYVPIWIDPIGNLRLMIMPCLMIGASLSALILRQTRASMLQVLSEDYVRTARAKGASEAQVIIQHALRNALIPIVTVIGLEFGRLIGGVVVTEMIFSLPGLGQMIVEGIFERDFAPLQAAILFVVVGTLLVNLTTDLVYAVLDKRVKLSG
jgi:peptide/nickel transport system permease protein